MHKFSWQLDKWLQTFTGQGCECRARPALRCPRLMPTLVLQNIISLSTKLLPFFWTNMKGDLEIPPFRPRSLDNLQCIALKINSDPCAGKIGAACSAWATRLIWRLGPDCLPRGDLEIIIRLLVCNRHNEIDLDRQWDDLIETYAPQIKVCIAADAPHFSPQGRRCDRNSRQNFRRKLRQVIKNDRFGAGYLYVYTCPYLPGFVKVGCSKDEPSRRIKE